MVMRKLNSYTFRFSMSKKGQFFILSAVIMASIIVTLASVQNYVGIGDAPKKFYYYSQQLEDETAAVVDYALYQDPTGDNKVVKDNLNKFLQQSIDRTLSGYPQMQLFACYTDPTRLDYLICQNNGTRSVTVNVSTLVIGTIKLAGKNEPICGTFGCSYIYVRPLDIKGKNLITVTVNGSKPYNIDLTSSAIQRNQFYFMLKMNTSSGDYLADSTGVKPA